MFFETRVVIECPFCGMTLVKTTYSKILKFLNEEGIPRGKICGKCGGVAVLHIGAKGKEIVLAKVSGDS